MIMKTRNCLSLDKEIPTNPRRQTLEETKGHNSDDQSRNK